MAEAIRLPIPVPPPMIAIRNNRWRFYGVPIIMAVDNADITTNDIFNTSALNASFFTTANVFCVDSISMIIFVINNICDSPSVFMLCLSIYYIVFSPFCQIWPP